MALDFNKEMDKYIEGKQSSRPTDFIIRRKKQQKFEETVPKMDDGQVIVEERELGFFQRLFAKRKKDKEFDEVEDVLDDEIARTEDIGELEREYEEIDETEELLEEKKQSIFAKILEKIKSATIEEEDIPMPEEHETLYDEGSFVIPQDLKEAMRIQNNWLKKLPPHQLSSFKASEDYFRYQEILRKYGLIK